MEAEGPGAIIRGLSNFVMRFPKVIVFTFVAIAIAAMTVLPSLQVYLSFYQLIPPQYADGSELTHDYFVDYEFLNSKFGGDNWDYYAVRPNASALVTDVKAIREMNAVSESIMETYGARDSNPDGFVTGTLSLAELVKIVNYLTTGRYEFPPDSPEGDEQIRLTMKAVMTLPEYRDQVVGNIVSVDEKTGILLVIMRQGEPLENYREYARQLKALGLEIDESNDYAPATQMYPINVDTIYLKLDAVTFDEGIFWVLLSSAAVITVSIFLFRSPVFTGITMLNLSVTVAATVAALYLSGGYLNLLTMLLVALIFGVGDDYTTYALTIYRLERKKGHSLKQAILAAQHDLGTALLICALVTLSAFLSIWLTGFPAIMIFGAMAGAGVFFSYVGCLTLVPALLWIYFNWVDRKLAKGERVPSYERLLRSADSNSESGERIANFALKNKWFITGSFGAIALVLAVPFFLGPGVETWGGSYSNILNQDSYEMTTYNMIARELGIPLEAVVFARGDITDPDVLRALDRLEKSTGTNVSDPQRNHEWLRADSLADIVRANYLRMRANPEFMQALVVDPVTAGSPPTFPGDADNDGLPDDRATLVALYERLWNDPSTTVQMSRVVDREYTITLLRVAFNAETNDGVSPVENARLAVRDLEEDVRVAQTELPKSEGSKGVDFSISGLGVVVLAVIEAIEFGNQWTTTIMIAVIFTLVTIYYRRPVHSLLIMTPLFFGVLVQYAVMSNLGYELTYVAVIITSVDMGLGIDLGVHTYVNFRAALRRGLPPEDAMRSATGDVSLAMIAALFTDMSAFLLIPWSDVTWAAQTSRVLLASVGAILAVAVLLLPLLFVWDAKRNPGSYGAPPASAPDAAAPAPAEATP